MLFIYTYYVVFVYGGTVSHDNVEIRGSEKRPLVVLGASGVAQAKSWKGMQTIVAF